MEPLDYLVISKDDRSGDFMKRFDSESHKNAVKGTYWCDTLTSDNKTCHIIVTGRETPPHVVTTQNEIKLSNKFNVARNIVSYLSFISAWIL